MKDFIRIRQDKVSLIMDSNLFNNNIQTKVLYWLSGEFIVLWEQEDNISKIFLQKKIGIIDEIEFVYLQNKINQDLIDFKTRDIIHTETHNIRNILLIKAFANNDAFEDYNLLNN